MSAQVLVLTPEQVNEIACAAARAVRDEEHPYYTQETSPLGKARHCELIRGHAIPGWKRGRTWFARKADVHKWIEAVENNDVDLPAEVLERFAAAGVRRG